ncbi:Uncharacterised protein [Pluralibacter gergoviae]|nr:Uncharacterised protein [Pluralibacter gergoviae]
MLDYLVAGALARQQAGRIAGDQVRNDKRNDADAGHHQHKAPAALAYQTPETHIASSAGPAARRKRETAERYLCISAMLNICSSIGLKTKPWTDLFIAT